MASIEIKRLLHLDALPKEPVTPYEHAKKLWRTIYPRKKPGSTKSVFMHFTQRRSEPDSSKPGVPIRSQEQRVFLNLTYPYWSLFPELDNFAASLSMSPKPEDISFKLTVFAPPPSPQLNKDKFYPILTIREIPAARNCDGEPTAYNLHILGAGENNLYSGKLDCQLVGFDPQEGPRWEKFSDWHEGARGDIAWRQRFTCGVLKTLTAIAELNPKEAASYTQTTWASIEEQKKNLSWRRRIWVRSRDTGAIWPEDQTLYLSRLVSRRDPEGGDTQFRDALSAYFQTP